MSGKLIKGNIPAGQPCPFFDRCARSTENCPVGVNVRPHEFSCAIARLLDFLLYEDDQTEKEG